MPEQLWRSGAYGKIRSCPLESFRLRLNRRGSRPATRKLRGSGRAQVVTPFAMTIDPHLADKSSPSTTSATNRARCSSRSQSSMDGAGKYEGLIGRELIMDAQPSLRNQSPEIAVLNDKVSPTGCWNVALRFNHPRPSLVTFGLGFARPGERQRLPHEPGAVSETSIGSQQRRRPTGCAG